MEHHGGRLVVDSALGAGSFEALNEGQRVQYDLVRGTNGKTAAENLKIVG